MCSHAHVHTCTFVHRQCPHMCTYGCMCSNVCADFHNACAGFHACTQHAPVCIFLNICVCTCTGLHTCLSGLCFQCSAAQKQQEHLDLNISQTNPSLPQTCSAHSPSEHHSTCFSGGHPSLLPSSSTRPEDASHKAFSKPTSPSTHQPQYLTSLHPTTSYIHHSYTPPALTPHYPYIPPALHP